MKNTEINRLQTQVNRLGRPFKDTPRHLEINKENYNGNDSGRSLHIYNGKSNLMLSTDADIDKVTSHSDFYIEKNIRTANTGNSIFSHPVGMGGGDPDASSILDLSAATTKAFILPVIASIAVRESMITPKKGMMIYNEATCAIEYYNGVEWNRLANVD
jgi:hypothetical protein